jgi:hypothetical protein
MTLEKSQEEKKCVPHTFWSLTSMETLLMMRFASGIDVEEGIDALLFDN